jgi:hypothetical protein
LWIFAYMWSVARPARRLHHRYCGRAAGEEIGWQG